MNKGGSYGRGACGLWAFFLAICTLAGPSGCASDPVPMKSAAELARPSIVIPASAKLAPVKLARVTVDIPRGKRLGSYRFVPYMCRSFYDGIYWNAGRLRVRDDEFSDPFYDALRTAGYTVVRDPKRLFQETGSEPSANYLVGARIDTITMDICDRMDWWWGHRLNRQGGSASLRVDWQIFDTVRQKVVYETHTDGAASIENEDAMPDGEIVLLDRAFEQAARNLAADQRFYRLLSRSPTTPAELQRPAGAPLRFDATAMFRGPIVAQMDYIRLGVVTISVGNGHGSGFFISPNLILTNNHVVDGNDLVRVTLVTGRTLPGAVVRTHPQRDVALVSVEAGGHSPLPLRLDRVLKIGEDVYAIGTPLDRSLSGTVTKGIVSAFRSNAAGLEDIQADVDINPGNSGGPLLDASGNVVGITYAAIAPRDSGVRTGLNLFIPIRDALDRLGLVPDAPRTGRPAASMK